MTTIAQAAQTVVDRYARIVERISALEAKEADGTLTPADSAFLQSFRRQRGEVASEVVQAKIASNEWRAEEIIRRMSA